MSLNSFPVRSGGEDGEATAEPREPTEEKSTSHAEALKSTTIMGGSAAVVMLIRMIRTKVLATFLGPVGVGLEAIFDSVLSLTRTAVDLGISNSGVRQIAAAVGTGDHREIAITVVTLRRVCMLLGGLGAAVLFLLREPISRLAFGNSEHASDIAWLAAIPLVAGIAGGQGALLQGMRRIGDLARVNILGAMVATIISIPIVLIWGTYGIPAYLLITALGGLLISFWHARKVRIERVEVSVIRTAVEARKLLQLGLVFVSSGLMTTGVLFLLRVLVIREAGLDGAGQFQAANALSTIYVAFVLQAMGTDFYPRLTAVATNDERCNQLVNEQAEISILLALPGVLATLALAPWVIEVFYSGRFNLASEILCWQVVGMLLRVISWPMGFIVLAKGRGTAFFLIDLAAYTVYAGLGWLGLRLFGLPGIGMAFLGLYTFHWCLVYTVVQRMSGFRWSTENIRLSVVGVVTAAIALGVRLISFEPWSTVVGCLLAAIAGIHCLRTLIQLTDSKKIVYYLERMKLSWLLRNRRHRTLHGAPVMVE